MSDTPETIAAVEASDGQWSFVLKQTCAKLERERDQWKADCLEQCKLLAMSADREDKLRAQLQDAEIRALYEQRLKNTYKKLLKQ
jgi:hypothetical protein